MKKNNMCECPVTQALHILGGKWKMVIICRLYEGNKRFSELKRSIQGITTKMLTQLLRELEEDNIVHREVYKQVPPKVEYSLTEFGLSTKPIIDSLNEWGIKYNELKKNK